MIHRDQRGSVSVELVLLTPVLVALLCLTVALGRIQNARADVEAASRAAARAASIERSSWSARAAGLSAAIDEMDTSGYRCQDLRVDLDTAGFAADTIVTATVSCTVHLSDVTGMGIPTSHILVGRFSEPVDRYRGTR